jgi:hypothetical protein
MSVIPAQRRIDWKPGVPGGIPHYSIFASVKDLGAKGDGSADDTAAIQRAIDQCPAGSAVLLPAGTYRLTAMLKINTSIVLRGEGAAKTRLINEAAADPVIGIGSREFGSAVRIAQKRLKRGGRYVKDRSWHVTLIPSDTPGGIGNGSVDV